MPSIGGLGGQWVRLWASTWAKTPPIAKPGNAYFLQLGRRWVRPKRHPRTTRNSLKTIGFCKRFTSSLTTNSDLITGTAADEVINGLIVTIPATGALGDTTQSVDIIDGGAGADTLNIQTQAGGTLGVTVKNVETINYTAFNVQNFNMANVTGVTTLNNKNSIASLVLSNASAVMDLSVQSVVGNSTIVGYTAAAVAGSANVQKIALNAATADHTIDFNDAAIETYELTSSGSANRVVLDDVGTTVKTIKVTGDQALRVSFTDLFASTDNITSFDASAATGAITANLFTNVDASDMNVKTGTANDTVIFGNFTKDDVIDLGAGTDTLRLDLSATVSAAATLKGVEVLQLTANGNYTLNGLGATELTTVNLGVEAGFRTYTLTNLAATANTLNLNGGGAVADATISTAVFGLKTTSGTADALTINIANVDASGNAVVPTAKGIQLSSAQTANGIENITINSATLGADTSASVRDGGALLTLTATSLQKLTLASTTLLDLDGSALAATVKTVAGSAANGGVHLDLTLAEDATTVAGGATGSVSVTTGSGTDLIANILGKVATTISSGAGNDIISTLAGTNMVKKLTIDAGAGNDSINISGDSSAVAKELTLGDGVDTVTVSNTQSAITINDFVAGVGGDKITFATNAAVDGAVSLIKFNKTGASAATDGLLVINGDVTQGAAATVAQIHAIQNINGTSFGTAGDKVYVAFDDAANTYIALLTEVGNDGAGVGADTLVVIATLVGVTDATTLTVDNFTNFLA